MTLEQFVKQKRLEKNLSQRDLANLFGIANAQYISNCERELCQFSEKYFKVFNQALDIPMDKIVMLRVQDEWHRLKNKFLSPKKKRFA